MDTNLIVNDKEGGKLIRFKVNTNQRSRLLFFFGGAGGLLCALIFLRSIVTIDEFHPVIILSLLMLVGAAVLGYRYFNKATETEEIFVDKEWLIVIEKSVFRTKKKAFKLEKISDFHFIENEKYTPHPLGGGSWDQFGLNARQKEMEKIHEEGNFMFDYGLHKIKFGKGQGSWVFNELDVFLYEYTGRDLRYKKNTEPDI
ncbi:MAG: hypothetical protein JNM21_00800 [Taibaiella sp.]|nr:hypothetical protein [Taibaiella sp.]